MLKCKPLLVGGILGFLVLTVISLSHARGQEEILFGCLPGLVKGI